MKSFLVVDDDPNMRALYKLLIRNRYDDVFVSQACNGEEALSKAIESDYSVIISDVEMPTMNGIDFHQSMKKESPQLAQRTAFISSTPDISYFKKEKIPYLLKPFEKDDFYSLVESMLAIEERNLNRGSVFTIQRRYERNEVKEACILEPLNLGFKNRGVIKGTMIDISEGGFGFVYKGEGLIGKLRATVSAESIGTREKKAEMVWAYKSDGETKSGFRWTL